MGRPPFDDNDNAHQIGPDTWITLYTTHETKIVVGLIEWHIEKGEWCGGSVPFDYIPDKYITKQDGTKHPTWHVESKPGEPLTLTPSIACTACSHHGFITNGVWVSC